MKTVYGPVPSWRLGKSLGIDLVSRKGKTCSFDCIYCQLGRTKDKTAARQKFVSTQRVKNDIKEIIDKVNADVITFSGTGEPTLASNLCKVVDVVRGLTDLPIAILTNSSLMHRGDVRRDLSKFDIVVAKLDASNQKIFEEINRPVDDITFDMILEGIRKFREEFHKKIALQMMFIDENRDYLGEMVGVVGDLEVDEIQINTPLRPSPVKPLSKDEISRIVSKFRKELTDVNIISVYEEPKPEVEPLELHDISIRRPVEDQVR